MKAICILFNIFRQESSTKELDVVILADSDLMEFPFESLNFLNDNRICSVSRDFSLQMLHERMKANIVDTPSGKKTCCAKGSCVREKSVRKRNRKRACPGFEPGTSRTRSENHTPRPTGRRSRISYFSHIYFITFQMLELVVKNERAQKKL